MQSILHTSEFTEFWPHLFYSPTWWKEWSLETRNDLNQFPNHWISSQTLTLEALISCLCECGVFLNSTDMGLALRWMCLSLPSVYCPSLTATATSSHWQMPRNSNDLSSVVHHLYSQDLKSLRKSSGHVWAEVGVGCSKWFKWKRTLHWDFFLCPTL